MGTLYCGPCGLESRTTFGRGGTWEVSGISCFPGEMQKKKYSSKSVHVVRSGLLDLTRHRALGRIEGECTGSAYRRRLSSERKSGGKSDGRSKTESRIQHKQQ